MAYILPFTCIYNFLQGRIMQFINEIFKDIQPLYPLEHFARPDRILFIDIETTGLSRESTTLYLIGCGYFDTDGYHTIQWFADSPDEEPEIITAFADYISDRFTCLMHFNGNRFDVPYLKHRALSHGIPDPLGSLESIDIYAFVKPYKKLLGLPSLRQRSIEQFLNINSDDPYTGKELIGVYHSYVRSPSDELLAPLLYHNSEDLKGMAYILPILHYTKLKELKLSYVSHTLHSFSDYMGQEQCEILAEYTHDAVIPVSFNTGTDRIRLSLRKNRTALLRLPVFRGELKKFYQNYRDYYYLPEENCCIHRSVASGVSKERRVDAKKETCYTKHSGLFIPSISSDPSMTLRTDYSSKELFVPYSDDKAETLLSDIGCSIISYIF